MGLKRIVRNVVLWAVPGAMAFGTSCADSIRDSVVAATLDFVESTAGSVLEAVVPVDELLSEE